MKNSISVGLVGLVSGALGAFALSLLGTPATAREGGSRVGKPYLVQISTAIASSGVGQNPDSLPFNGVLFRLWSDGAVDTVAFSASPPQSPVGHFNWSHLCNPPFAVPPAFCTLGLGVVPDDPAKPADLNVDGQVDGADLGLLLGDWSGRQKAQ